jgi:hypothetical protein
MHHAVQISVDSTTVITTMTQYNAALQRPERTTLPMPGNNPCSTGSLSNVNVHDAREIHMPTLPNPCQATVFFFKSGPKHFSIKNQLMQFYLPVCHIK